MTITHPFRSPPAVAVVSGHWFLVPLPLLKSVNLLTTRDRNISPTSLPLPPYLDNPARQRHAQLAPAGKIATATGRTRAPYSIGLEYCYEKARRHHQLLAPL
jgi:hypothetical protein